MIEMASSEENDLYQHSVVCSGDRRKPIGSPGCCCLRLLREAANDSEIKTSTGYTQSISIMLKGLRDVVQALDDLGDLGHYLKARSIAAKAIKEVTGEIV
jgi:hypothetical protein